MIDRALGHSLQVMVPALVALSCLFAPTASAQDNPLARTVVYRIAGMDQVVVKADVSYTNADGDEPKMDIYMPPGLPRGAKLPAVLFIHGGYLPPDMRPRPKDWGVFTSFGRLAAASGLIGITFNHRYYGWDEKNFAQSLSDVTEAIAYARAHAEELHVDPQRLCLWAFSGGGPLLTVALQEQSDYIRCLVSYYAILDLRPVVGPDRPQLTKQTAERYSPVAYINGANSTVPPVFIARAGLDNPDLNRSVDSFLARALENGLTVEVANHPAGRHAFDVLDDDDRSREIIERTIEFIKTQSSGDHLADARDAQGLTPLRQRLAQGDIEAAKMLAASLRTGSAGTKPLVERVLGEATLNLAGYELMRQGKTKAAVAVFEWVVEEHPESPNAYDSLADGYEAAAREGDAVTATQKALALLESATGSDALRKDVIRRNCESRLQRLK